MPFLLQQSFGPFLPRHHGGIYRDAADALDLIHQLMQHLFIPSRGLYSVPAFNPNDIEQMQSQGEPDEAPASPLI